MFQNQGLAAPTIPYIPVVALNLVMLCHISNISESCHPSIDIPSIAQGFYDLPKTPVLPDHRHAD